MWSTQSGEHLYGRAWTRKRRKPTSRLHCLRTNFGTNKLQSSPKIGDAMVVTNNKETSKSNKADSKYTGNVKGTGQDKTKENKL